MSTLRERVTDLIRERMGVDGTDVALWVLEWTAHLAAEIEEMYRTAAALERQGEGEQQATICGRPGWAGSGDRCGWKQCKTCYPARCMDSHEYPDEHNYHPTKGYKVEQR